VCPTLGYSLVPAGTTITVPDEEAEHWLAGGWTPADPVPAKQPAKTATTPEGTESA
jgi:hypothetical protein